VKHDDEDHWTRYAACRGTDPELFYPVSSAGPALAQVDEAKAICGRCVVQSECLSWALRPAEPQGGGGATTPQERRYLRHAALR
jgi:WhiB family redox-sensing transcriptional regulator